VSVRFGDVVSRIDLGGVIAFFKSGAGLGFAFLVWVLWQLGFVC